MHCYIQYLLSGQVPTLEYGKPIGHVLNEISNTIWYNQLANIRYNSLATKHQQTKECDNWSSYKNYSATLYYNTAQLLAKAGTDHLEKSTIAPWKTLSDAQACLCVDQVFSNFLRMSHYSSSI